MSLLGTGLDTDTPITRWLHGLWEYYRDYTRTAVHAASTAALTAFGLLIFVDRIFVVLAIITYVCPPVILYSIDSDVGRPSPSSPSVTEREDSATSTTRVPTTEMDTGDGDTDSDSDGGDTDSDGVDSDTDGAVSDATG